MNILITDDEAPARGELRYLLEQLEPNISFTEARNGEEALLTLSQTSMDVVFLDINMPGLNGLSVASTLLDMPEPPLVVFATAYDEHAVKAFELEALDYVVKPFDERRLEQTVGRIKQSLKDKTRREEQQKNVRKYLNTVSPKRLRKLWAERENENRVLLDYDAIYWLEADEKKVFAHTSKETMQLRYTLKELEFVLQEEPFVRVHKANLINLNHMLEVIPWFSGNYMIRMNNEQQSQVKMSRRYAAQLKELTDWR